MGLFNRGNKEGLPPMKKPKTEAEKAAEAAKEEVILTDKQGNPINTVRVPGGLNNKR